MKVCWKLTAGLLMAVLFEAAASAQQKQVPRIILDYSERKIHCDKDPQNDPVNCTALKTSDGGYVGLTKICPQAPKSEQDRLETIASNEQSLEEMSPGDFEKMGWCKLSADEAANLLTWHYSRMPSRIYYDTNKRADRRIYVTVLFDGDAPDIAKSTIRSALRRIADVEVTDNPDSDFTFNIGLLPVRVGDDHKLLGYAVRFDCFTTQVSHDIRGLRENIYKTGWSYVWSKDDLETNAHQSVASLDTTVFEDFRKSYPYHK
jgi:hypothetical protein